MGDVPESGERQEFLATKNAKTHEERGSSFQFSSRLFAFFVAIHPLGCRMLLDRSPTVYNSLASLRQTTVH